MIIKELNKELINRANSASFDETRGTHSEQDYKTYVNRILELPVSDEKKQKLLDTLFKKWEMLLIYEAQHVSVMVAGPAKYNAKRLDKSDKIIQMYAEISEWWDNIQNQIKQASAESNESERLKEKIKWLLAEGLKANAECAKLAEINKEEFKKLFEELNAQKPFRKNTVIYKLYANIDNIEEKKKIIFENADFTAYTEGGRGYIKFVMRPKRQLIVALKSRGRWWNSYKNAWSTYEKKVDTEWIKSISERYADYI